MRQVARITRHRTETDTARRTRETVYVITDLPSSRAKPEDLARAVRGQWGSENRIHYVRDTLWDEDHSRARTGHGPENTATLRNTALNRLRADGATNIAAAVSDPSYQPFTKPLDLLGIPG